jgi:hypothetical protein
VVITNVFYSAAKMIDAAEDIGDADVGAGAGPDETDEERKSSNLSTLSRGTLTSQCLIVSLVRGDPYAAARIKTACVRSEVIEQIVLMALSRSDSILLLYYLLIVLLSLSVSLLCIAYRLF